MQMPTHFVAAILIDKLVAKTTLPSPAKLLLVAGAAYLSHGILDKLARATYHPPDPLDDTFWRTYHHSVLPALNGAVSFLYGPKHLFAMAWSILPDLDWVVRGISRKYRRSLPGWEQPILNEGLHSFLNHVPLVNQLNRLPDLRFQRRGVLVELGLVIIMFGFIQLLGDKTPGD
jgi:hypothetical protein